MTDILNVIENRRRFSGQGTVTASELDEAYAPGGFWEFGTVPSIQTAAKTGLYDLRNTTDGSRALEGRLIQTKDFEGSLTFESFAVRNVALRYYGRQAVIDAGSITGETLSTRPLAADDLIYTAYQKVTSTSGVSSLVLTDSATSPATLTDTHYELVDPVLGKIRLKSVSALTQPIKAAYSYAEQIVIPILTDAVIREFAVRIEIRNTAQPSERLLMHLYRVQFDPDGMDELIQEKGVLGYKLKFTALQDPSKPVDAELGQWGYTKILRG